MNTRIFLAFLLTATTHCAFAQWSVYRGSATGNTNQFYVEAVDGITVVTNVATGSILWQLTPEIRMNTIATQLQQLYITAPIIVTNESAETLLQLNMNGAFYPSNVFQIYDSDAGTNVLAWMANSRTLVAVGEMLSGRFVCSSNFAMANAGFFGLGAGLTNVSGEPFASTNAILLLNSNATNEVARVAEELTNHVAATDANMTNHVSAVDANMTNHVTAVDSNMTNHVAAVDANLTNHVTAVAGQVTNHVDLISSYATNETDRVAILLTNEVDRVAILLTNEVDRVAILLTNHADALAAAGTNETARVGAETTNEVARVAAELTNHVVLISGQITNHADALSADATNEVLRAVALTTNHADALSASATNEVYRQTALGTNHTDLISGNATNEVTKQAATLISRSGGYGTNITILGSLSAEAIILTNNPTFATPATASGAAFWYSNGILRATCWTQGISTNITDIADDTL